jgi:hypothetical protein
MTNQKTLIQETQDEIATEMSERLGVIDKARAADQKIQARMDRGEIGISRGTDKVVALMMFILATAVTLLAMYFVFQINPAHYQP